MKSAKTYLGVLIVSIISLYGCKKEWLDAKADKQQAVPSTLQDFQALMDNVTNMNYGIFCYGEVACDGHSVTDAVFTATTTSVPARNAYIWTQNPKYSNIPNWQLIYNRIFNNNVVLDGLAVLIDHAADHVSYNNIKGQALVNRAEAFYFLAQLFASPYSKATATEDWGIPMRLNSDITIPTTRARLQSTYDQIITDLKTAAGLLPKIPTYPTRAGKPAAYGALARTYLSMMEYDSALVYAGKCLQISHTLMDFTQLSTTANFIGMFNAEVIFHEMMYTSGVSNFITTNYLVDTSLFNQYDANDLRKTIYFKNTSGRITFKGNYYRNATDLFCGIATDELYLIRAECYARAGKTTEAMKDLNDLLRTRWKKNPDGTTTYIDQTAANADEALVLILTERRKELILRGLRWSDLRRLNKEDRFKVTLTRTIGGQTYTLEPNSYKYTFPIPDDIIQQTGMPQNPGWDQ